MKRISLFLILMIALTFFPTACDQNPNSEVSDTIAPSQSTASSTINPSPTVISSINDSTPTPEATNFSNETEETKPLLMEEARKRIASVMDVDESEVIFKYESNDGYAWEFNIKRKDNTLLPGLMNAHTGRIFHLGNDGGTFLNDEEIESLPTPIRDKNALPIKKVKEELKNYLAREYGSKSEFVIYNVDDTDECKLFFFKKKWPYAELYRFEVYGKFQGYKVYSPQLAIAYDPKTGAIEYLQALIEEKSRYDQNSPEIKISTDKKISYQDALKFAKEKELIFELNYKYIETAIIEIEYTGEYEFVHIYQRDDGYILYLNAQTGERVYGY